MEIQPSKPRFIDQETSRLAWLKSLEDRQDGKRFFRTGFKVHDQVAGAFRRGGFYLVAARPGIGKTAFLTALAYYQAKANVTAYFANLEMSNSEMWTRLACFHDPDLTLKEFQEGELSPEKRIFLDNLSRELKYFSPRYFEDTDFQSFAKAVKEDIPPSSDSIVFLDYIGLLSWKGLGPQDKYALVSEVAKQLKIMARVMDIPVIAAVQLSRKIEDRKDKKPNLADLRDSGELENHADAVFALSRDGGRLDVDILKNRNGPAGTTYSLAFHGPRAAIGEDW